MTTMKRFFVSSRYVDVTCIVNGNDGTLYVDAMGHHMPNNDLDVKNERDIALAIMRSSPVKVKTIHDSYVSPEIVDILRRFQRAVTLIERAVLSPHTTVGKARLLKEFELFIDEI